MSSVWCLFGLVLVLVLVMVMVMVMGLMPGSLGWSWAVHPLPLGPLPLLASWPEHLGRPDHWDFWTFSLDYFKGFAFLPFSLLGCWGEKLALLPRPILGLQRHGSGSWRGKPHCLVIGLIQPDLIYPHLRSEHIMQEDITPYLAGHWRTLGPSPSPPLPRPPKTLGLPPTQGCTSRGQRCLYSGSPPWREFLSQGTRSWRKGTQAQYYLGPRSLKSMKHLLDCGRRMPVGTWQSRHRSPCCFSCRVDRSRRHQQHSEHQDLAAPGGTCRTACLKAQKGF